MALLFFGIPRLLTERDRHHDLAGDTCNKIEHASGETLVVPCGVDVHALLVGVGVVLPDGGLPLAAGCCGDSVCAAGESASACPVACGGGTPSDLLSARQLAWAFSGRRDPARRRT